MFDDLAENHRVEFLVKGKLLTILDGEIRQTSSLQSADARLRNICSPYLVTEPSPQPTMQPCLRPVRETTGAAHIEDPGTFR
jgi:hypothetical protein